MPLVNNLDHFASRFHVYVEREHPSLVWLNLDAPMRLYVYRQMAVRHPSLHAEFMALSEDDKVYVILIYPRANALLRRSA